MRIVIAEDDSAFARSLARVLRSNGHDVRVGADGSAAWALFQADPVPVVLSDWVMPGIDGLTLCRNIRRHGADLYTYFILITGNAGREKYLQAMDAGVDDFLHKPLDQADLLNRIRVADRILTSTARIKRLESLLPICSYCKRIQENSTEWLALDAYMQKHADAEFSHGICPGCLTTHVEPHFDESP